MVEAAVVMLVNDLQWTISKMGTRASKIDEEYGQNSKSMYMRDATVDTL